MRPATGIPVQGATIPGTVIEASGQSARTQDLGFAIAFIVTALAVFVIAFLPAPALPQLELPPSPDVQASATGAPDLKPYSNIIAASIGSGCMGAIVFNAGWLLLMRGCARQLVTAALVVPVLLSFALVTYAALLLFAAETEDAAMGACMLGGIGLLSLAVNLCWLRGLWTKIPVTAMALSLASNVTFALPATMVVAGVSILFQLAWAALATGAAVNIYAFVASEYDLETEGGVLGLALTPLLVAL